MERGWGSYGEMGGLCVKRRRGSYGGAGLRVMGGRGRGGEIGGGGGRVRGPLLAILIYQIARLIVQE